MTDCIFCRILSDGESLEKNQFSFVIEDRYPSSPGHGLIIPIRHVVDPFELNDPELIAMFDLARSSTSSLKSSDPSVEGFNIGFNVGGVAGQTVEHLHLHIIPRCSGDVSDPRGGIRWVLPSTAPYWNQF